jgi:SAM-dependent methyltransferase
MTRKSHWEHVYATKAPNEVSWYQTHPLASLELIAETGAGKDQRIIDVGGGASTLVDHLLEAGYRQLSVLDISGHALEQARARLGERAEAVEWVEADVTRFAPTHRFTVWHDRAVFHFLTDAEDRRRYVSRMTGALEPNGHVIIATFGLNGPAKCSGLDVVRYDPPALARELGDEFELVETRDEVHTTPADKPQHFTFCRFAHRPASAFPET